MAEYKWQGWGFLPLFISKKSFLDLVSSGNWKHWSEDLQDSEIKDIRRFYTRATADLLRPMKQGRYVFEAKMSDSPLLSLVPNQQSLSHKFSVCITKLQLLQMGEVSLLYLHFESSDSLSASSIAELNRTVFQWEPRTERHSVCLWEDSEQQKKGLKQHISDILSLPLDNNSHYEEDAFGHELVSCSWVKQVSNFDQSDAICVSELSAGINFSNPRYKLSENEKQRLIENQFHYWSDWRCQFNLNRLVFVDQTPGESSLNWNLATNQYYLDLLAAVICQRTTLGRFKDEMILSPNKQRARLYERISLFRRSYKMSHVSTYPFAERLYQYLCCQADLELIEQKAFVELEHNHALWKQEKDESSNTVLLLVSLVAALLVPASSIATIMALTKEQMNLTFWAVSGSITLITAIVMIWPPLRRYFRSKD
ncbi:hypothetical protein [Vibrio splendidus]|uniref:hypothetical protein n=1 Tax=Vibrio splendidus TaxID=29497 RepID=UPI0021B302D7|nr:hypothetical protein [Vibrio splendidus]UWZ98820.1 hypothetical protein IM698_05555 [Vibrio splendidus]